MIFQLLSAREVQLGKNCRDTFPFERAHSPYSDKTLGEWEIYLKHALSLQGDDFSTSESGNIQSRHGSDYIDSHEASRNIVNSLSQRIYVLQQFSATGNLKNAVATYLYASRDPHFYEDEKLDHIYYFFREDAFIFYQNNGEGH